METNYLPPCEIINGGMLISRAEVMLCRTAHKLLSFKTINGYAIVLMVMVKSWRIAHLLTARLIIMTLANYWWAQSLFLCQQMSWLKVPHKALSMI